MALGTFIAVGRSLETALQRVELAERLGYESVYVTHIAARDSVTTLMAYASRSERIRLGTGVMPIYTRTPVATAQSFATLDEFSGGRAVCGLGVSHRPVVESWYGQTIDKPLRETREYVGIVRAIFAGEDPPDGREVPLGLSLHGLRRPGRTCRSTWPGSRPRCSRWRARSPTAWCSGCATRTTCATWWCPRSATDARRRVSRSKGFDIVAAVPSAVSGEPEEARGRLRAELIPYFSLPFYRAMLERSGFEEDLSGFDRAMSEGGPEAAAAAISDRFLQTLAAVGSADEAGADRAPLPRRGSELAVRGRRSPKTDFDVTLEALAGCLG